MSTNHIDVAPARWRLAHTALACGIAGFVLSFIAWDWFDWGGIALGYPLAIVAVAAGLRARRDGGSSRALGTAAVALGIVVLLIPLVWIAAGG
jgi:hypothetical protein